MVKLFAFMLLNVDNNDNCVDALTISYCLHVDVGYNTYLRLSNTSVCVYVQVCAYCPAILSGVPEG